MDVICLARGELDRWDRFVDASRQGTAFCYGAFVESLGVPYTLLCAVDGGGAIQAGAVCLEDPAAPGSMYPGVFEFTPYQGVLVRDPGPVRPSRLLDHEFRLTELLVEEVSRRYGAVVLPNSWMLRDIRPFSWHGHHDPRPGRRFRAEVRYTSLSELGDPEAVRGRMRENHRRALKRAGQAGMRTEAGVELTILQRLYVETFGRQGVQVRPETLALMERIFLAAREGGRWAGWTTWLDQAPVSCAFFLTDSRRAYYLWGSSDPAALAHGCSVKNLFDSMVCLYREGCAELDWVGVNSPRRGFFKQGFGGRIEPYYVVARDAPGAEGP